jgi:serine/threonine-protein kinase
VSNGTTAHDDDLGRGRRGGVGGSDRTPVSGLPTLPPDGGPSLPSTSTDRPDGLCAGPPDDSDRFELLGPGSSGGEGTTWKCRFRGTLSTPVMYALKQLRPPAGASPLWPEPADVRRWNDQRHLLQTLDSEHLVRVHDMFLGPPVHPLGAVDVAGDGREFAVPYLVMEWVDGPDLRHAVQRCDIDLAARLGYVHDLADALDTLHSATRTSGNPMLHRDVKPENCLLHLRRGAVLVDLGTLRPVCADRDPLGMHTRHYTAPEVLADPGAARTAAADLYGLGAVAFFCVVGTDPPAADERDAPATILTELQAAAARQGVADPAAFAMHLAAMLHPVPGDRPSRAGTWAARLAMPVVPGTGRHRAVPMGLRRSFVAADQRPVAVLLALAAATVAVLTVMAVLAVLGIVGPTPATPVAPPAPTVEDLALAVPQTAPACDGRFIVLVGSAVTPGRYREDVAALLAASPGANYFLTEGSCGSIAERTATGDLIYAVYHGPFDSLKPACASRLQVGDDSVVRQLSDAPVTRFPHC